VIDQDLSGLAADDPPGALRIALLGAPKVTWSGRAVALSRRQTRALLYRLAVDFGPASRSHLCFLFWPDVREATARRNLSRLLALLRRALPDPAALVDENDSLCLDPERVWSDTVEFSRLTATAGSTARRTASEQAVELARGPLMEGFALPDCPEYEAWMEGERRTWERRVFDALAGVIEAHTAAHDYASAIAAARRYLEADALAEDVHRRLIALHSAAGDRTAALRQFEQCAVILERELGVSPMAETRAVYEAARDGDSLLPDGRPHRATTAAAEPPPVAV